MPASKSSSVMLESCAPEYACLILGALKLFWKLLNLGVFLFVLFFPPCTEHQYVEAYILDLTLFLSPLGICRPTAQWTDQVLELMEVSQGTGNNTQILSPTWIQQQLALKEYHQVQQNRSCGSSFRQRCSVCRVLRQIGEDLCPMASSLICWYKDVHF